MEIRMIAQRLASAESRVQHGEAQVNRQRILVKHLEDNSLSTFQARKLLKELEDNLASFVEYRDRLEAEMVLLAARAVA